MRRTTAIAAGLTATLLGAMALVGPASAGPPPSPAPDSAPEGRSAPEPVSPLQTQQQSLRRKAMEQVTSGTPQARSVAPAPAGTVRVGQDYVEVAQQGTAKVFVVLAEFGDQVDNTTLYRGQVKYGGAPGPLHNAIPDPAGTSDNHTIWRPNFDRAYYEDMYFSRAKGANSLRNYLQVQSSGRYDISGYVSDWVKLPYNEARYGSDLCDGGRQCPNSWDLIRDSLAAWHAAELAKGRTPAQIKAQLAEYDQRDQYDHDRDGNFNEPDGYIDNYEVIHAGVDQTWGGGAQGAGALWAHRWFAYWPTRGTAGPEGNKQGGTQVADTGIWVGDYLTAGENSGLGLVAHENGHLLLGLPDLYAATGGNGVDFWSLMSDASYLGRENGATGEYPGDLDAWSKLQLGWLNYDTAQAATESTHVLGVSSYNTAEKQAVLVNLPPRLVHTPLVAPFQGAAQWWSGRGDYLDETLTRSLDLTGATTASVSAKSRYWIEEDFDYLYGEVSTDNGTTWKGVGGTVNGAPIPNVGGRPGLTGSSAGWVDLNYNLDGYAGGTVLFRVRYVTDTNTAENGFLLDTITVKAGDRVVLTDDVEGGDNGWTARGFTRIGDAGVKSYPRAYLVENRRYVAFGQFLQTGPYNFGWNGVAGKADQVERYPYQDGVLVWLWDPYYSDNTTRDHPGAGMILPVDVRATPMRYADGAFANPRAQVFDATLGLKYTDAVTLHRAGVATTFRKQAPVAAFNDRTGTYWYAENPDLGVKVPDTNTRIEVVKEHAQGRETTVRIGRAS
ncbi:immune inhibitor A domain-containing protein [Longispora sp. NPDC051575]|uniref:immune inhibitor A domain-containing protein n=1 Tax=Longispora sp. NPDC051575 TaxID=3154943 RepID=UPI00341FBC58